MRESDSLSSSHYYQIEITKIYMRNFEYNEQIQLMKLLTTSFVHKKFKFNHVSVR